MERDNSNTASLDDWEYMPATVVDHKKRNGVLTLITADSDEKSNILSYPDDRDAQRVGAAMAED